MFWIAAAWAGESVGDYNDRLVQEMSIFVDQTQELRHNELPTSPSQLEPFRLSLRGLVATFHSRAEALPGFEGDTAWRDSLVDAADVMQAIVDEEFVELFGVVTGERVVSADVERVGALFGRIEDKANAADAANRAAQKAFAARHNLRLLPSDDAADIEDYPEFCAPGLVPPGVRIPPSVMMALTVKYHNGFAEDQNAVVGVLNAYFDGTADASSDIDAARRRALDALAPLRKATHARGDWRGDRTMIDATEVMEAKIEGLLEHEVAEMAQLSTKGLKTQAAVDAYNKDVRALNAGVKEASDAWVTAEAAFWRAWHFEEFNAYVEARRAWEASQRTVPAPATETAQQTAGPEL